VTMVASPPQTLMVVRRPRHDASVVAARAKRMKLMRLLLGFVVPVASVALWQTASSTHWIDSRLYPSPTDVIRAWQLLWSQAHLFKDVVYSLRVIVFGFLIGSMIGLLLGLATGLSTFVRSSLEPILGALYVVPKLALLPILLTILGFDEKPKIALVAITVFFYVWISTMEALTRVAGGHVDAARAFGAGRLATFRHVYLPAMLPELFVALRISMGVSVLVTVAAEFIVGSQGVGFKIFNYNQLFLIDRAYAAIVTVAILGVVLMWIVAVIGRRVAPWQRAEGRTVI